MRTVDELMTEALSLPSASRVLLVETLIESLEFNVDETLQTLVLMGIAHPTIIILVELCKIMESLKINTYVGDDGVLQIQLPVSNEALEVIVIYQPIPKRSHGESKKRFEKLLSQYNGKIFSDSAELLR